VGVYEQERGETFRFLKGLALLAHLTRVLVSGTRRRVQSEKEREREKGEKRKEQGKTGEWKSVKADEREGERGGKIAEKDVLT